MYRCEATSIAGFIQQLTVAYVQHGYWFYVTGRVPGRKDPEEVDRKLIDLYAIDVSRWTRYRRRQLGLANVQYLRFDRFFVLIATHGRHVFFDRESRMINDVRRRPIRFAGYSVSFKRDQTGKGHAVALIDRSEYQRLRVHAHRLANNADPRELFEWIRGLRYEPYAGVRRQLASILRSANIVRRGLGFSEVPVTAVRRNRRIARPFQTLPASSPGTAASQGS